MTGFTPELLWQQVFHLLSEVKLFENKLTDTPQLNLPSKDPITLYVAFSGGLDSTTLLHALSVLVENQEKTFLLQAIHINHQLQKASDDWVVFCREFCGARQIAFQSIAVDVLASKKGIEAAARSARYSAFDKILKPTDILLTGHHLDDQVETVFLQLLRGTGVDGAAAIAPVSKTHHKTYHLVRPLLNIERKALQHYAEQEGLSWIEDPSNVSDHFNRNFLRHNVLPIIEKRWPSYRKTVHRFSRNARSASAVLEDYIAQDYALCADEMSGTLTVKTLKAYPIENRLMIIRHWLKQHCDLMPSEKVLMQVHSSLDAATDSNPLIEWGACQVRRYQHRLYFLTRNDSRVSKASFQWHVAQPCQIKGLGRLVTDEDTGNGLLKQYLDAPVTIHFRQGGENCQPAGRSGTHSLKKLMQEYAIPPWERDKIPLLMIGNQIAAVVGHCYCEPFAAKEHELGVIISLTLDLD